MELFCLKTELAKKAKGKTLGWFQAAAWKLKCRANDNFVSLRNFPGEKLPAPALLCFLSFADL